MARKVSALCEDALAEQVSSLAREHEVSEQEAVRQLLEAGLERT